MSEFAITTLWIASLLIPGLVLFCGGRPRSFVSGSIRSLVAIGCGWAFTVAYAEVVEFISQGSTNGAVIAYANVLGWIMPSLIVGFCLLIQWLVRRIKNKPHQPSDQF